MADEALMSIGEVASASGLRASALRYYEEEGLIQPIARKGGRRHYDPSTLRRLAIIALCQEVGFTVAEIAEVFGSGRNGRKRWRELAERKLTDIDAHIGRAQAARRLLRDALACGCGDLAACDMVSGANDRRLLSVTGLPSRGRQKHPLRSRPG